MFFLLNKKLKNKCSGFLVYQPSDVEDEVILGILPLSLWSQDALMSTLRLHARRANKGRKVEKYIPRSQGYF